MAIVLVQFEDWMITIADWTQNPEIILMEEQGDSGDETESEQSAATHLTKPKGASTNEPE
jgi:hypothetical protein